MSVEVRGLLFGFPGTVLRAAPPPSKREKLVIAAQRLSALAVAALEPRLPLVSADAPAPAPRQRRGSSVSSGWAASLLLEGFCKPQGDAPIPKREFNLRRCQLSFL